MSFVFEEFVPDNLLRIIISMAVAVGVSWNGMPVIRNICEIKNLSDNPIKRSSHKEPIPTFGGVGIFAGTLMGYHIWNFMDEEYLMHKVFLCTVILFFMGIKDDIYALSANKKLISQIAVALVIVVGSDLRISSFFGIFGINELPYILSILFTVFLIVALINSFNLIDGIDGLSGGVAMIVSGGFALWFMLNNHWSLACLGFSLASAILGFLRFNFSKTSKIFMGDTGSLVVGFLVAVLAIKFVEVNVNNSNPESVYMNAPIIALALLCVPIFDTLRVFSIRILRGKSPFKPDRLHLHHVLVDLGIKHEWVSLGHMAFTVVFTLSIYFLRHYFSNTQLAFGLMGVFVAYVWGAWICEKKRLYRVKYPKNGNSSNKNAKSNDDKIKIINPDPNLN